MNDLPIKNGLVVPAYELEITASRAGGPGGQHVNKTSTRISVRWNVKKSRALNDEQKERILDKLHTELTADGDVIVHSGSSRSQAQNKKDALEKLARKIRKALHIPKKRMKAKLPKSAKEARMQAKKRRGDVKRLRRKVEVD